MDLGLVKRLRTQLDTKHLFSVKIADGGRVATKRSLAQISVIIQDFQFLTYVYVIPLGGCDVVLGIQWLRTLGPILWDFAKLYMQFCKDSRTYCITSPENVGSNLEDILALQMQKLLQQDTTMGAILYHLESESITLQQLESQATTSNLSNLTDQQQQELNALLEKFESIFSTPKTLPPHRLQDHKIPLIEGSTPPNSRPYRYGPVQKTEIEKCVKDLLEAGFIRMSNSLYSSPVILVRKKEGTWRMCMDYRGLNGITIKDKFPIPLIDELLDELYGAHFFSKQDLRACYHQIRMQPDDIEKTAFRTHDGHFEFLVCHLA